MSKPNLSFRIPKNLRDEIEEIQRREGIEDRSEAARQVLRRGIEHSQDTPAGEQLAQQATGVAAVGAVVATLSVAVGQSWAFTVVLPFWTATFLFAILWASVRTLAGRDLL